MEICITPDVGPIHLEDEEDRARDGERAKQERRDDRRVLAGEKAEAEEEHRQPEHEHDQERPGNTRPAPVRSTAAGYRRGLPAAATPGSERTAGRPSSATGSRSGRTFPRRPFVPASANRSRPTCPRAVDARSTSARTIRRNRSRASFGVRPKAFERAIELEQVNRDLLHFGVLGLIRAMRGGNQQAEDERRHGCDQSHHQLDHVPGIGLQMVRPATGSAGAFPPTPRETCIRIRARRRLWSSCEASSNEN